VPIFESLTIWVLLCVLCCGLLLWSEGRGQRAGVWLFKPLASTGFVATAVAAGGLESSYGRWILAGLVLCWLGDVLLIPERSEGSFLAGIASFLLGHVAYTIGFATLGLALTTLLVSGLVLAALGLLALRWLGDHLRGVFVVAVPVYVVVIGSMAATSLATVSAGGAATIAVGALLFAVSDLFVARDRFVAPGFANAAWGLPLYYGAQLVLATTVATVGVR
jgi:uncharacterized membrane protein YhhN